MKSIIYILIIKLLLISACGDSNNSADAYGNFEVRDILVSAQSAGQILELVINEGDELKANQQIGLIDSSAIYLQIKQVEAQKSATATQFSNLDAQIKVQEVQKQNLITEIERLEKLVKDGAETTKKLDTMVQQKTVIKQSISTINVQKSTISAQLKVVDAQKKVLENQLAKCTIINPSKGTVLKIYSRAGELAVPGKALYKLADMSEMELKVYISGEQLPHIKLSETVKVLIDKNKDENTELSGTVSWISNQAEFTPKIIQTKEERVNLVYAVKIVVKNDGVIKIGMPAEVIFNSLAVTDE